MKTTIQTIALIVFVTTCSLSQTQTLLNGNQNYGGFGGPLMEVSNINGQLVTDVGGGGALIINNFFIGGYGLGNDDASITVAGDTYDINFGHSGLWFGYTLNQHKLFHLYSSFRLGWGEVELREDGDKVIDENILALTPELGLEVNVTGWFKLGLTGGYRYVNGLQQGDLDFDNNVVPLTDDNFSGVFGMLTFRFGGFGSYSKNSSSHTDMDTNIEF